MVVHRCARSAEETIKFCALERAVAVKFTVRREVFNGLRKRVWCRHKRQPDAVLVRQSETISCKVVNGTPEGSNFGLRDSSASGVRRDEAALSSGCKAHPRPLQPEAIGSRSNEKCLTSNVRPIRCFRRSSLRSEISLWSIIVCNGRQACFQPALALSSQRRVASSVQPGTAKRSGALRPGLWRTMACWCMCKCTVAALAEAPRAIKRPNAKRERIVSAPLGPLEESISCMYGTSGHADEADVGSQIRPHH